MRCDEIREQFVELLYSEAGMPSASPELRAHVQSCPACQKELEDLKQVRVALRSWKDEAPIRPVLLPKSTARAPRFQFLPWALARYAAIAAIVVLAFLAGLHYNTRFPGSQYPTREEVRGLVKEALADSEARMTETTNLGLQRALETVENEQDYMYQRLTYNQVNRNRNRN